MLGRWTVSFKKTKAVGGVRNLHSFEAKTAWDDVTKNVNNVFKNIQTDFAQIFREYVKLIDYKVLQAYIAVSTRLEAIREKTVGADSAPPAGRESKGMEARPPPPPAI